MRSLAVIAAVGLAAAQAQSLAPSFAPPADPPGMIALSSGATPASTLDQLAAGTHGYISTGISSDGGHGVEGDVLLPILPGRVTLEVGGGTGRTGVWLPTAKGAKTVAADNSAYHVAVHAKVTDDLDLSVAFSQQSWKLPRP